MIAFVKRLWPPTKSCRLSILWAFALGAVLQIAVPLVLAKLGLHHAMLFAIYPGLLPIIWATGGWFAGITPLGYVILCSVNTMVYVLLIFILLRTCVWVRRLFVLDVPTGPVR
jgi:hypothetical protein